jgi:uncharacterized protein (TIGR02246 family)
MNSDEQAIGAMVKRMEAAWNAGDGAGFAAPFTDDATFTHVHGGQFAGRAEIAASHQFVLDTMYKGSRNQFTLTQLRFIRPDVAIGLVEAVVTIPPPAARELHTRASFVAAKDDGAWRLVHFHNTPVIPLPAPK